MQESTKEKTSFSMFAAFCINLKAKWRLLDNTLSHSTLTFLNGYLLVSCSLGTKTVNYLYLMRSK
jgi:hypothetical protein